MKLLKPSLLMLTMMLSLAALTQDNGGLDLKAQQRFLDVVEPIITQGEREIYKRLPSHDGRRYFQAIFWYKRDSEPTTTSNHFRKTFFERRQIVSAQFGEGRRSGLETDRGITYLLLGEPESVDQNKLAAAGLRPGYEEVWHYPSLGHRLRFVYDGLRPDYRLQSKESWLIRFEKIRNQLVVDRAEPYRLSELALTLPHIGFTKDIENLAADDKFELSFNLSYAFFKGDANRTEVLVGITFNDASTRGMDINLAAYDPYGEKSKEFKKLIEPENGRFTFFSMAIEPDQYTMVLRVNDRDGREGVERRLLDVPALRGSEPNASSLMLAKSLAEVPLYGFMHPKKFVYDDSYFPMHNDFSKHRGKRIYVNQIYYNFNAPPSPRWYIDHQLVTAVEEKRIHEGKITRLVVSLPLAGLTAGKHGVKSLYADESGSQVASVVNFQLGESDQPVADLISLSVPSEAIAIIHPKGNSVAQLERVVMRVPPETKVTHMYTYLNGRLILEQDQAPWDVNVPDGSFSISGQNQLVVVLQTDRGLLKAEKTLTPLNIEERFGTRAVQIYFNAFNKELKFVHSLDFNDLSITVNGKPHKPNKIKLIEEPITYCFLVDVSYSMKDAFAPNISAVRKFIQSMRPQDKGYFVVFSDRYQQIMQPNLSKSVLLAVADSLKLQKPNPKQADKLYTENETYLYDSVIAAIHSQIQYSGRSVILMVTDGVGVEGIYKRNGMLSYARENETVIYSLWLDNNPRLSEDEKKFLELEMSGGERFARKIGLARFFTKKDARKIVIGDKVRNESITQGVLKILSEESGGYHYRIFRDDRSIIKEYVTDISEAVGNMFVATLTLPVSRHDYEVNISSTDENLAIRNKSKVKVSKTNPLLN